MHTRKHAYIVASNPNKDSLTVSAAFSAHRILSEKNVSTTFHHLDTMAFSPTLPHEEVLRKRSFDASVVEAQKQISNAGVLALFFPDWWGMPPALLVGWLQRTLSSDIAFKYEGEDFMPKKSIPLLTRLRVFIALCSDETSLPRTHAVLDTLESRLTSHAGIQSIERSVLHNARECSASERKTWIEKNNAILLSLCESL